MKTKVNTILAQLMISGLLFFSAGDPNDFDKLLSNLEKQTFDYVQEKVYLHLDRPYYSVGDDLWFKAYTVAGPNHTPTPLSENLFVELIDPTGRVVKRHTIFMSKGLGKGDFQLADSLKVGAYQLRAYTNWMRNFDEAFFYHKTFNLINPFDSDTQPGKRAEENHIRFFPEGGELIASVPGTVAVEWPEAAVGEAARIVDTQGQTVVSFKMGDNGLGKFSLLPEQGKQYFLEATGLEEKVALPKARDTGYVLSVDNLSSDIEVLVNVKTAQSGRHQAYLVAHTRGMVGFGSKLDWQGAVARVRIPRKDLGDGITHLTLFNSDWKPEAERLVFQNRGINDLDFELSTDKEVYEQRDSTTINLKLTDPNGEALTGFFSMNVYDAGQINPNAWQDNIVSNLLLTSDLKGDIANPLKYMGDSKETRADLDLLLLTKGWSRFTWKDLLEDQFPETVFEVEQGFKVTGRVTQRSGQKGLSKASVQQVGAFEGIPLFAQAQTDGRGDFEMTGLHFYKGESVLKAKDKKGKSNVKLLLDSTGLVDFPETIAPASGPVQAMPAAVTETFTETSKQRRQIEVAYDTTGVTDLGTVIVEADEIDQNFANMQRGLVFGRGEYSVSVSDLMAKGQQFVNALYTVQRVPGVTITLDAQSPEPVVQMTRKVWSLQNPDPPIQYYIDDSPVDLAAVTALPAGLVERVEILKGMRATGLFGPSANGGAIMFYTKSQEEQEAFLEKFAAYTAVQDKSVAGLKSGYYHSREFYTPDYFGEGKKNPKPDFRDLIHWAPMIQTDEKGEAQIKFFNADLPATIRVQVEGIWEGGIPITGAVEYKVKR